ncbi:MAG: deoxyuridine 5'-triphosphate nucleotidohydrolase [Candidatus Ratteibacteria bacterium]|nr:deoxyuridine 5'-triphosphate nucleotidohydrolase [Candidatus Ratteibacteria bacterium]
MILNKNQIAKRILNDPPMVDNIIDLNVQLQPTGLDLTVKKIYKWASAGELDFDNSRRILSEKVEIELDKNGWYQLAPGSYQIEVNELFNMPLDVAGETIFWSSLQRCGAAIETGFFDPGYIGKGVCLLIVSNKYGLYLSENARVCQIIFHETEKTEGYNGVYHKNGGT